MPPPPESPYNERLAAVLRKDSGYMTRAAWKPRELLDQFSWLCGAWNYTLVIPGAGSSPERKVSGSLEYRFSRSGAALQLALPGEEPVPYIVWDGFNGQFVLSMLEPRSFGHLTSKGWRGDRAVFEGNMTFVGLPLQLRQTWVRRPGGGSFTVLNEERLASGALAPVDQYTFLRVSSV